MDEMYHLILIGNGLLHQAYPPKTLLLHHPLNLGKGEVLKQGINLVLCPFYRFLAPELNDRILADFLDMESNLLLTMHIQSVDQTKAIKTIKRKITDLDKIENREQKRQ